MGLSFSSGNVSRVYKMLPCSISITDRENPNSHGTQRLEFNHLFTPEIVCMIMSPCAKRFNISHLLGRLADCE